MTAGTQPEPPPQPGQRRAAWLLVLDDVQAMTVKEGAIGVPPVVRDDMIARHHEGIRKYGVPLTSDNGRDHLVDAYQESLDLVVYLRAELDKRGAAGGKPTPPGCRALAASYAQALGLCVTIRTEIEIAKMAPSSTPVPI